MPPEIIKKLKINKYYFDIDNDFDIVELTDCIQAVEDP